MSLAIERIQSSADYQVCILDCESIWTCFGCTKNGLARFESMSRCWLNEIPEEQGTGIVIFEGIKRHTWGRSEELVSRMESSK